MSLLDDSVTKGDNGWDFVCPVNDGTCGNRDTGESFASREWPTKETARARAQEHFYEHKEGVPMSSLEEFRAKHKLSVTAEGKAIVSAKDL